MGVNERNENIFEYLQAASVLIIISQSVSHQILSDPLHLGPHWATSQSHTFSGSNQAKPLSSATAILLVAMGSSCLLLMMYLCRAGDLAKINFANSHGNTMK